jgi:mannose-6-phosphate isomerase-like protein (cupin superfamily)
MDRPELAAVEWVAKTDEVAVRVLTLVAGEGTPWHFHTQVTDHVFALDDGLVVALRDPEQQLPLRPGERTDIAPRRVHRVLNASGRPLRYLLVQATGRYDFNAVE